MQAKYQETGGIDGRNLSFDADKSSLSDPEFEVFRQLVIDADIFGFHAVPHIVPEDAVFYEITVGDDSGNTRSWSLNNAQVWPTLQPLVDFLHIRAH